MARYIDADAYAFPGDLVDEPTADVVEMKKIEIIRDDLKWWLETNSEKGVVYIPEFVVENMIAKMDGAENATTTDGGKEE